MSSARTQQPTAGLAPCYNKTQRIMAIFNVITFLIHAITGALASLLGAVFTRLLPALVALAGVLGVIGLACTSCGVGGVALLRRRKRERN